MSATKGLHFMMQQYHYDMICVNQQELYNENMLKKKKKVFLTRKLYWHVSVLILKQLSIHI